MSSANSGAPAGSSGAAVVAVAAFQCARRRLARGVARRHPSADAGCNDADREERQQLQRCGAKRCADGAHLAVAEVGGEIFQYCSRDEHAEYDADQRAHHTERQAFADEGAAQLILRDTERPQQRQ